MVRAFSLVPVPWLSYAPRMTFSDCLEDLLWGKKSKLVDLRIHGILQAPSELFSIFSLDLNIAIIVLGLS